MKHTRVEYIDGKPHMRYPREEALEELVRDLLMLDLEYAIAYCEDEDMNLSDAIKWAEADKVRRARELGVEVDE